MLGKAAAAANPKIKSRAFNSDKVSAHHGIVPTVTVGDFDALTDKERKLYMLIARAYIAQFFPPRTYRQTGVLLACEGHEFTSSSRVPLTAGWSALYKNDAGNEALALEEVDCDGDLATLAQGTRGECSAAVVSEKETKPPKRYTLKTLLLDLPRAAKYIRDPKRRALLVERDK
ncbi:DNA topoisomerase III, partial [Pseudomonas sp. JG-B]|nr:DNA topoisomerase III [Pseudomonas sp. JG-B]